LLGKTQSVVIQINHLFLKNMIDYPLPYLAVALPCRLRGFSAESARHLKGG